MNIKKIDEIIVVTMLVLVVILVFLAALLRWFGVPVAWSVDVAQLLFVWVCFLGANIALKNNKHIGIDLFTRKMPFKMKNYVALFNNIIIVVFLAIVFYYGAQLSIDNFKRQFNTLPISYSYVTLSAPVGCFLMLLTSYKRIKDNINNIRKKESRDDLNKQGLVGESEL